jgi:glycosyltransferase involved in cell wall biosynthesis
MKILILNSEYPPVGGGAGNATANIARLLAKMGSEVVVLTSQHGILPREEVCEGVRILRGPTQRRHADRSTALEQVSFIIGASFRSLKLMRQFKPDVTLAFFGLPSGAVAWLLKFSAGIPYVVSLRGGDVPGFRPYDFWLYHRIAVPWLHLIWHSAAAVVANSKGLYDLAEAFDSGIEISIIPNGVDAQKFQQTTRDWSPPRILSVGRVVYQKGYDVALNALADLKDLEWEWYIAGDGPNLRVLQGLLHKYQLQDRVHFLGWEAADEVRKQYAQANLFLHPSRHEGMPNAILEAMASGLPVIATHIAGNEELVLNGITGLLVPVDDTKVLRDSLRQLLVQARRREEMGLAARLRVEESFGWIHVAEQYQSILEKAIE